MQEAEVEILLVDGSAEYAGRALEALRAQNPATRIFRAGDGEEALDFLFCRGAHSSRSFQRPPRVVLLRLGLAKVDGLEVLRRVKSDPRTKAIPVVILSGSNEEADVVGAYRNGANSYVQTPADGGQFREAVSRVGLYWLAINRPPPAPAFFRS